MDPAAVIQVEQQLDRIEADESVAIGLAIESGSRAWGFPSPDSDYDCRFLFVRRRDEYLTPWPRRNVIELPLDGLLDINGWDLAKALRLILKGNAVVVEWLMSPIRYREDRWFRDQIEAFARNYASRNGIGRHYLHLGERQRRTYFGGDQIALKKLFYALRPAAALRWLRLHPDEAVAPMHFPTLMAESDPPLEVAESVDRLLRAKLASRELGTGPLPPEIAAFIDREFAQAHELFPSGPFPADADAEGRDAAEFLFRLCIDHFEAKVST